MPSIPFEHDRKSIRLKGYDYTQNGLYFITLCVQHHKCLFGRVQQNEMILNDTGKMIDKWWLKIPEKFPSVLLYDYVVMPNHFHGIVVKQSRVVAPQAYSNTLPSDTMAGGYIDPPLHRIVQWFKVMSTNNYIRNVRDKEWMRFDKRLWQRNYYEHIIRSEKSYSKIAGYIQGNPAKWQDDKYYTET